MTTPARRQYLRIKNEHKDAILLFRLGDFFETFDEDAKLVARELEIALTSREMGHGNRVPLAGIPCHSLEPHLAKLIKRGHKVAICEQTSAPSTSKGLVDREVVRVVTPGTVIEDSILDRNSNNYLAAVVMEDGHAGFSYVDITTGDFLVSQFKSHLLSVELSRINPSEILISKDQEGSLEGYPSTMTPLDIDLFNFEVASEILIDHFRVVSLEAYGCEELPLAVRAAGVILDYLKKTQKTALVNLTSLHTYSTDSYMVLEPQTRRNLELFEGGRWGNDTKASLLSVLDQTRTSMGGRLLRRWLGQPLLNLDDIVLRQNTVAWFHKKGIIRGRVSSLLDSISDLERIVNKVRSCSANPRDLVSLRDSLAAAPQIREILGGIDGGDVSWLAEGIDDHKDVVDMISKAIVDSPPPSLGQGQVIRDGFCSDLDNLRNVSRNAQEYIAGLQSKERERTGIKSLKVGFNKVFGYYIEVSKSNLSQVPEDYIRRQTLVGGERFITPEMKEHESLILNAQERVDDLEGVLYRDVCGELGQASSGIIRTSQTISQVDVFYSLGEVASRRGYVRPLVDDNDILDVKDGRHPVVERTIAAGSFVANDVRLSNRSEQLIILTGPNMSGKSTYIRQVAIIVLMAQVGSFVPARSATIGLVDRIFTRVGLQDDLAVGQSTFMIEMLETAMIINQATSRSLVVLDEIGRGTSTYDGLAIAQAVAEHIHSNPKLGCKTLFATHYHELTHLAKVLPRAHNYNVTVSEDQGDVVFLRRILPGAADRSYGVYVARLAGLPGAVINRAWEVLKDLENGKSAQESVPKEIKEENTALQQPLFKDPCRIVVENLMELDVESMTPLQAITKLYELQDQTRSGGYV